MSVINTNILALTSQNNLQKSQTALGSAIERLSSGMRINSAKDDAAGQAIANRFTSNVRGLTQAARNANDGISIAQTTEGALDEINNNIQRIRELTVQAANGSNSPKDLSSIQEEINERLEEINRISDQTDFNGVKVLSEGEGLTVQVGAHDFETITIGLKTINQSTLGLDDFDVTKQPEVVGPEAFQGSDGSGGTVTGSSFTFSGTSVGDNPTVVKGEDDNYYVKSEDGEFYAVSGAPTVSTSGTVTVAVGEKLTAEELSESGLAPLAQLDVARDRVDELRSHLGAIQNRFESTITNLNNTVNNLSAARSRIEDADYAVEVSNMTRAQILQQAGTSVLAQANQVPQTVLSLLR